ncbi:MAG: hypothetical protein IH600_01825 [Bacteroidetes bacterium]|nr:hypothetical protein [Bacteroidota bacterium]
MRKMKLWILFLLANAVGLTAAWVDSQPKWDDTGVMAMGVFLLAGIFGAAHPRLAWLWALGIGLWIPLNEGIRNGDSGAVIALAIAFAGAYSGVFFRRVLPGNP